jgi:hypothetical protein
VTGRELGGGGLRRQGFEADEIGAGQALVTEIEKERGAWCSDGGEGEDGTATYVWEAEAMGVGLCKIRDRGGSGRCNEFCYSNLMLGAALLISDC